MFQMFVDLISFHLESIETAEKSRQKLSDVNHQLADSIHVNSQFKFISNDNLQEPLRKMRVFTGMMLDAANKEDLSKVRSYAAKVDSSALKFSAIINELSEFTELYNETNFEMVDLNKVVFDATGLLSVVLGTTNTLVRYDGLPTVVANRFQMEQLFRNLITNSIQYAKKESDHVIQIHCRKTGSELLEGDELQRKQRSIEILIEDNGEGFSPPHLQKIFDIFSQFPDSKNGQTEGHSLAYCRKIVNNHGGQIKAESVEGKGTTFSIVLPVRTLAVAGM